MSSKSRNTGKPFPFEAAAKYHIFPFPVLRSRSEIIPARTILADNENDVEYAVVYKIVNDETGDSYIGVTVDGIFQALRRIAFRSMDSSQKSALYRDLSRFGARVFSFSVLLVCPSEQLAEEVSGIELGSYNKDLPIDADHRLPEDLRPSDDIICRIVEQYNPKHGPNSIGGLRGISTRLGMSLRELGESIERCGADVEGYHDRFKQWERPTDAELRQLRETMSLSQIASLFGASRLNIVKAWFGSAGLPYPEYDNRIDRKLVSKEEVQRRLDDMYHGKVVLLEYSAVKKPGTFRCDRGHVWKMEHVSNIFVERQHGGCPICRQEARADDEYKEALELIEKNHDGTIKILEFTRMKGPATFQCSMGEDHIWTNQFANGVVKGIHGCPFCAAKSVGEQRKWSREKVQEMLDKLYDGNIEVVSYTSTKEPGIFRCRKHGKLLKYNQASTMLMETSGDPCPKCLEENGHPLTKPYEEFLSLMRERHLDDVMECLDYKGMWSKTRFRCKVCCNEWNAFPKNIIYHQTGCPVCSGNIQSFPECAVFFYARQYFGPEVQKNPYLIFEDDNFSCRGDIYIPSMKTLIEYDGTPWHDDDYVRERDAKREHFFDKYGLDVYHIREYPGDSSLIGNFHMNKPFIVEHPTQRIKRAMEIDAILEKLFSIIGDETPLSRGIILNTDGDTALIKDYALEELRHEPMEYRFPYRR